MCKTFIFLSSIAKTIDVLFATVNLIMTSVTRLGNLLDFGQVFEAFGNNYFAQIDHILRQVL